MSIEPDLEYINALMEAVGGMAVLEPRKDFDNALLGVIDRCGSNAVACYDANKVIEVYVERDGLTQEEAVQFFYFHTLGAYSGDEAPYYMFSKPGFL